MTTVLYIAAALLVLEIIVLLALPKTKTIRETAPVNAPASAIFKRLSELEQAPSWLPGCTAAEKTAGREGPARKQRITLETDGARVQVDQQVTTWVNDRQYGWKETPPSGPLSESRTVFTLTERGSETEIEILGEATARNLLGKVATNFGFPSRQRATYRAMLANLKSGLEAR